MNLLREWINRVLRGPAGSHVLNRLGIDAKRYWLLTDLFQQISERREVLGQLGRDSVSLKLIAWIYFAVTSVFSLVILSAPPPWAGYLQTFLGLSSFLLFTILLSETSNSIVNPVESLVLAHQPVNGATYTAAKLTHLLRIVAYFELGLNAGPALAGLALKDGGWWYPAVHLLAALLLGLILALLCCALFGWLVRFVPAPRLKAAGQIADALPWLCFITFQSALRALARVHLESWLPSDSRVRTSLFFAAGIAALAAAVFGLRCLSGDYLVKVTSIMHGRSGRRRSAGRSWIGDLVGSYAGPPARGGFSYVGRMMLRDWQFRKQLIPLLPALVGPFVLLAQDFRSSPFSNQFAMAHVVPHIFGVCLFFICMTLPYGSDYKGAWVFQLAPSRVFTQFVRGVHALLWLCVAVPHVALFVVTCWFWGWWQSTLFTAFSLAVASTYLALELRMVDGIPFGKQIDPARGTGVVLLMFMVGCIVAVAIAIQHFLLFRSPLAVLLATLGLGGCAWQLTRRSLKAFAETIRYHLGLESNESGSFYVEIS